MVIALRQQDQQELKQHYPKLNFSPKRLGVWGTLDFACSFDSVEKELVWDDTQECFVRDAYEIRIDFSQFDTFGFPKVYEESGVIRRFAEENGIDVMDLHINKDLDGSCCLGIFPEYEWRGVVPYIQEKIVPFFYWQSYRRIYGKEPWKGYAHGDDGLKEAMTLPHAQCFEDANRNRECPCGSGRRYESCCLSRDQLLFCKLQL